MGLKLKDLINDGLNLLNQSYSCKLGDRTKYLGATDLVACPRKVFFSKTAPIHNSEQTAIFARGHLAEELIVRALKKAGQKFSTQVKYVHPTLPIKCHCDIVFKDKQAINIVEVKSCAIPETPYPKHIKQLKIQMLLAKLNNPKKVINGSILYFDVKTGVIACFDGYTPNTEDIAQLENSAKELWQSIQTKTPLKGVYNDFCGSCSYKKGCDSLLQNEFEFCENIVDSVKELKRIKTEQKRLSLLEEEIKNQLEAIPDGKYNVDNDIVLSVGTTVRNYLQNKIVIEKYPEINNDSSFWKQTTSKTYSVK